jgi:hypothetical protein
MTSKLEMLEIRDLSPYLSQADSMARMYGEFEHSYDGFRALQRGCLGELIAAQHLRTCGVEFIDVTSTKKTHDFEYEYAGVIRTLEVKSKERGFVPEVTHEGTVSNYNKDYQVPDDYFFVSLYSTNTRSNDINRFTKAHILGTMSRTTFLDKKVWWPVGKEDPTNGYIVKFNCWNVFIQDMTPPRKDNYGV